MKKSTKARRTNGAKATNQGKLLHGVPVVLMERVPPSKKNGKRPAAAAGVTLKTVFRAKLPKNVNYEEELYALRSSCRQPRAWFGRPTGPVGRRSLVPECPMPQREPYWMPLTEP